MSDDRLKLVCANGCFSTLLSANAVQTVYTDYGGTSRTSSCKPMALLVFAQSVLDFYSDVDGNLRFKVGGD